MNVPAWHLLVCSSSRLRGEPKGGCQGRDAVDLVQYLEGEICDRGLADVLVTNTGCLQQCDDGPLLVVYPAGWWYGKLDEERVDRILDCLEQGQPAQELLLNA